MLSELCLKYLIALRWQELPTFYLKIIILAAEISILGPTPKNRKILRNLSVYNLGLFFPCFWLWVIQNKRAEPGHARL